MMKLTTVAIGATCLVLGAGGATLYTQAATGPAVYNVYEANITDEAAYTAALPDVDKIIKATGGERVAGGFHKAKLVRGKQELGNRYVIVRWPSEEAYAKGQSDGIKAWVDKHAPDAREVMAEGVEGK
jgi:hypothetical protein